MELQDYSKELLAGMLADLITFEDSDVFIFQGTDIDFKGVTAYISGLANSYDDLGGNATMDRLEIYECTLYFDDDSETHFNISEIDELVDNVKLYKI